MPKKNCPLAMRFSEYLSSMDDCELDARVGVERGNAFRDGMLDTSRYYPHPANSGKALHNMADNDAKSLTEIQDHIKKNIQN
jgi:hypothetical protein